MAVQTLIIAPVLTALMLVALSYDLMADGGWHDDGRSVALACVVLFVAAGWLHARALARRGSDEAASVMLWWTFVASAFFFGFSALLD
jgi:hypothetical protein